MPDTFAITIIFIALCTVIGAFMKGRSKDACLKDFSGYPVTLKRNSDKEIWGTLRVEHSALELIYKEPYIDKADNQLETTYILYKNEYGDIRGLVRHVDSLSPALKEKRERLLKRASSPSWHALFLRRVRNFFGTIRDSLIEIANLFMGRVRSMAPVGQALQGQDKYISKIQQEAVSTLGTSYEPVLERYIGKRIILAVTLDGKKTEYSGILKEYTPEFIEVLGAKYRPGAEQPQEEKKEESLREIDLVIPRTIGVVRHLGE